MRSYYVKRKSYYFTIEKRRRKRRVVFSAMLASVTAALLLLGSQGMPGTSPESKTQSQANSGETTPKAQNEGTLAPKEEPKPQEQEQQKQGRAQVAIVIDDVGYIKTYVQEFQKIKTPLTFSVMPHSRYGKEHAELFHSLGQEIIVHLPLENSASQSSYGPGEIGTKMSDEQILEALQGDLDFVPYAKGMNNHEGKYASADLRVMRITIDFCKQHNLFFLDSLTTPMSVVGQVQEEAGMPKRANDWFIDNRDEKEEIKKQIQKLGDLAKREGCSIGIGHIQRMYTPIAIQEMIPVLQSQGVDFVFLSQIKGNR